MVPVLDQTSDINGQQLYRLSKLYDLPPFVKTASSDQIYGNDNLEAHQYANAAARQFPCHTSAATYISTLFFLDKQADMAKDDADYILSRLDDFAFLHGISERISVLREKTAQLNKVETELEDDDFGCILSNEESGSGKKERYFPMRNALETKKAAEYLEKYSTQLPYNIRQRVAEVIIKKADKFGADLGDLDNFLYKQAGYGVASSKTIANFVNDRAMLLRRANKTEYANELTKIATVISEFPALAKERDHIIKLAGFIDTIDREVNLIGFIDDLSRPEDVFFSITEKTASDIKDNHFRTTTGNIYRIEDCNKIKLAEIKGMMGDDFANAVSDNGLFVSIEKLAEIASTLPRNDADLLDGLLSTLGIVPIAKEAADSSSGFDMNELKGLAMLHAV